ncbi:MAG: hypothetical protein ACFNZW_02990, partial [Coriobacteriaceae bacterium]
MVLKGTLRCLVPLRLSARSQAPRADLLVDSALRSALSDFCSMSLNASPLESLSSRIISSWLKCDIDLSHVRAFKSSCSLAIANDTWNPSLWLVPLFTP